ERRLRDWLVDCGRGADQRQQLVRLEEVPLALGHLQAEVAIACRVTLEQAALHGVLEDPGDEVQGHIDRPRAERAPRPTGSVSQRDAGFARGGDLLVSLELVRDVR